MTDQNATGSQSGESTQNLNISFANGVSEGGVYANAVSVHVNLNEVVLDFGYSVPSFKSPSDGNSQPTEIKVLQRVNLNHRTAESFLSVLQNALLDFRNKVNNSRAQAAQNPTNLPNENL